MHMRCAGSVCLPAQLGQLQRQAGGLASRVAEKPAPVGEAPQRGLRSAPAGLADLDDPATGGKRSTRLKPMQPRTNHLGMPLRERGARVKYCLSYIGSTI